MKDGPRIDRYTITHKDGKPIDPAKRYFVLSPESDPYARTALAAYIGACRATHPVLARSLAAEYGIEPEGEWAGTIYDTAP